jgi:hypothetical protein
LNVPFSGISLSDNVCNNHVVAGVPYEAYWGEKGERFWGGGGGDSQTCGITGAHVGPDVRRADFLSSSLV